MLGADYGQNIKTDEDERKQVSTTVAGNEQHADQQPDHLTSSLNTNQAANTRLATDCEKAS